MINCEIFMMVHRKLNVAQTEEHLRDRVSRMLKGPPRRRKDPNQQCLFGGLPVRDERNGVNTPLSSIWEFLGFACDTLPTRNLYLFGGVLRDLALYGSEGFSSDIDLVVDDDWSHLVKYLTSRGGATRNRFGGLRLHVNGQPVDIWNARETWAIREGLVQYRSIESLTETTILNWDAILLNWSTQQVICRRNYFRQIQKGLLDVVLVQNPNPLGAAVRAFRHFCLKDAKILTVDAARYLGNVARRFSVDDVVQSEMRSYCNSVIDPSVLIFFRHLDTSSAFAIRQQFDSASGILQPRLL